jgi:hypothetical protein
VYVVARPDGTRVTPLGGEWVQVFTRHEFLTERWHYGAGEHTSLIGPTQLAGKTTLLCDLLGHTDTSWCARPPTMLVAKPRDKVVAAGIERLGWTETDRWPPRRSWWRREKPSGYAYWPKHLKDVPSEVNDAHISAKFDPAFRDLFWTGDTITVADELYHLLAVLRRYGDVTRHLTQGGGMGSGLWFATQKPSGTQQGALPGFVFNSPTHSFFSRDPVKDNRRRFAEVGGVDPAIIEEATYTMPPFWWLYIHRVGPKLAIIEAA